MFLALFPLVAFVVYGTVTVPLVIWRRRKYAQGEVVAITPQYENRASRGLTVPQILSFIMSLVLLGTAVALGFTVWENVINLTGSSEPMSNLIVVLMWLCLFTVVTIIVNCFWIYSARIIHAESQSPFLFPKLQKVLAWLAWGFYLLAGWALIVFIIVYVISQFSGN